MSFRGNVGEAALLALGMGIVFLLALNRADPEGLGRWFLVRDPRPRNRLILIGAVAGVMLLTFFAVLWVR